MRMGAKRNVKTVHIFAAQMREDDDDRVVFRSGGGCLTVLGVPILCAGAASLGAVLFGDSSGHYSRYIGIAFSVFGVALGLWMSFGRWGTAIDRKAGTVRKHWRWLILSGGNTYRFAEFNRVQVTRRYWKSRSSSGSGTTKHVNYDIELKRDGADVTLAVVRSSAQALHFATAAALMMELDIEDRREGKANPVTLRIEDVKAKLHAVAHPELPTQPPPQPEASELRHERSGDESTFTYGPLGTGRLLKDMLGCLPFMLIAVGALFGVRWLIGGGSTLQVVLLALAIGLPTVPVLILMAIALPHAYKTESVTASSQFLVIDRRMPFGSKRIDLRAHNLEEIFRTSTGVGIDTCEGNVVIGVGLQDRDKDWLQEILYFTLNGGS